MLGAIVKFEMDKLPVLCASTVNSSPEIAFVLGSLRCTKQKKKEAMCKTAPIGRGREHVGTKRQSKRSPTNNVHSVVMKLFYIVHTAKYTHTIYVKLSVEDWGYRP